jgi:hypothetical protein
MPQTPKNEQDGSTVFAPTFSVSRFNLTLTYQKDILCFGEPGVEVLIANEDYAEPASAFLPLSELNGLVQIINGLYSVDYENLPRLDTAPPN